MATTVNIYVDPDASGTGAGTSWTNAYTSLNAAVTARDGNIVTADEVHHFHCRCSANTADTTSVTTLAGYTTDSTRRVIIEGEEIGATWDATKYRIVTGGDTTALAIDIPHVDYKKLQIQKTGTDWNMCLGVPSGSTTITGATVTIDRCNLRTFLSGTHRPLLIRSSSSSSGSITVTNTIMNNGFRACSIEDDHISVYLYGCTLYHPYVYVINSLTSGSCITMRNCLVWRGSGTPAYYQLSSASIDYCADRTAEDPGAHDVPLAAYSAAQVWSSLGDLESPTNFHLASGSPVMAVGIAVTGLTTDVDGEGRADPPCIGADELPGVRVLTSADLNSQQATLDAATIGQIHAITSADLNSGAATLDAPTCGPVLVTIYVDPDAAGGGTGADWTNAYTSLNAAIAAHDSNLTTSPGYIHSYQCRCSAGTADTTALAAASWANYVTGATRYIEIVNTDGHDGKWTTGNHYRVSSGSTGNYIPAEPAYLRFTNLQIETAQTATGTSFNLVFSASGGLRTFDGCIFKTTNGKGIVFAYPGSSTTSNNVFRNCIIEQTGSNSGHIINLATDSSANCCRFFNCTIAGRSAYVDGITGFGVTTQITNVVIILSADSNNNPINKTVTADCLATDPADSNGTNYVDLSGYTMSQVFVDYTNGDYHLCEDSPLIGVGADLSAVTYGFTTDIDGDTITGDWSIGADWVEVEEVTEDELTAADLNSGAATLDAPTIGQVHVMTSADLNSQAATLDAATIAQIHVLTSADLNSEAATLDGPTCTHIHVLTSADLNSEAAALETTTIGQVHGLTSADLNSQAATLDAPTIAQGHAITSAELTSQAATLETPTLAQVHVLTGGELSGSPGELDAPTIAQVHAITSADLNSQASVLDGPAIAQIHVLASADLNAEAAALDEPLIDADIDALTAADLNSQAASLDTPTAGHIHVLTSADLNSQAATLDAPLIGEGGVDPVLAADLNSEAATLDAPDLGQYHALSAPDMPYKQASLERPSLALISLAGTVVGAWICVDEMWYPWSPAP